MNALSVVLISVLLSYAHTLWISDITSSRGFNLGNDMFLYIEDTKANNSSLLERISLRIDNGDMGMRVGRNTDKKAIELDFYAKDQFEGRGKKVGNMLIPFMLGAAGGGAMSMVVGAVKMMVMKSLIVAKIALLFSIILVIGKLMHGKESHPPHVEVEHHGASELYPIYTEYSHSGIDNDYSSSPDGGGYSSGGYGGYSYNNYVPSAAAESVLNYATVDASGSNNTVAGISGTQRIIPAGKKRDYIKRKTKFPMILTIRSYSEPDKGLI